MGVSTSNGESFILHVGDLPQPPIVPQEGATERQIRYGRNGFLALGGLGVVGNGIIAAVDTLQNIPHGESLGVASREAAMVAVAGLALEGARRFAKRSR